MNCQLGIDIPASNSMIHRMQEKNGSGQNTTSKDKGVHFKTVAWTPKCFRNFDLRVDETLSPLQNIQNSQTETPNLREETESKKSHIGTQDPSQILTSAREGISSEPKDHKQPLRDTPSASTSKLKQPKSESPQSNPPKSLTFDKMFEETSKQPEEGELFLI